MMRTCNSTEIDLKEEEDRIQCINFLTRQIFAVLHPLSLCPLSLYHLSLPHSLISPSLSLSYIAMSFNSLFLSVPYISFLLFVTQNGSLWYSNSMYKHRKYIRLHSHLFFEGRLIVPPLYEVLISILLIGNQPSSSKS